MLGFEPIASSPLVAAAWQLPFAFPPQALTLSVGVTPAGRSRGPRRYLVRFRDQEYFSHDVTEAMDWLRKERERAEAEVNARRTSQERRRLRRQLRVKAPEVFLDTLPVTDVLVDGRPLAELMLEGYAADKVAQAAQAEVVRQTQRRINRRRAALAILTLH